MFTNLHYNVIKTQLTGLKSASVHRLAVLAVAGLFTMGSAYGADVPASVRQSIKNAKLQGQSVLRWFGFKVYDSKLFTQADLSAKEVASKDQWASQPFAIELTYARDIPGQKIAESSSEEIERLQLGSTAQRKQWADTMLKLFPNVATNDRIIGVHHPKEGAEFFHNDKPIGKIADTQFSAAFFAIWMDERSKDKTLRTALLNPGTALLNPSAAAPSANATESTRP
jgi:Chalcone isomerase-like